jgi:hypothetical protein
VGKCNLLSDSIHLITGYTQHVHIHHSIAIDVDSRALLGFVIENEQKKEIRLLVVIVRIRMPLPIVLIQSEYEERFDGVFGNVHGTVKLDGRIRHFMLREISLILIPFFNVQEDSYNEKDGHNSNYQYR